MPSSSGAGRPPFHCSVTACSPVPSVTRSRGAASRAAASERGAVPPLPARRSPLGCSFALTVPSPALVSVASTLRHAPARQTRSGPEVSSVVSVPSGLATVYEVAVVSSVATTFLPVFRASSLAHSFEPLACRAAAFLASALRTSVLSDRETSSDLPRSGAEAAAAWPVMPIPTSAISSNAAAAAIRLRLLRLAGVERVDGDTKCGALPHGSTQTSVRSRTDARTLTGRATPSEVAFKTPASVNWAGQGRAWHPGPHMIKRQVDHIGPSASPGRMGKRAEGRIRSPLGL